MEEPESYSATESTEGSYLYDLSRGETAHVVGDSLEFRLHEGSTVRLPLELDPMETNREVHKHLGIKAVVMAEVQCSRRYAVLFLDRGEKSQGKSVPIIKNGPEISDRFLVIDGHAMIRLNLAQAGFRRLTSLEGITQLCLGETVGIGRNQAQDTLVKRHDSGKNTKIPPYVSIKHATIAVPDETSFRVSDMYSTNGTFVVVRDSLKNRSLLEH